MRPLIWIRICAALLIVVLLFLVVLSATNIRVISSTRDDILLASAQTDKTYDCILVLGAGIKNNSTPSDMLADRLDTAIALYNRGYSDTLFLSGDRSGDDYDEVAVMKSYCIDRGVSDTDIVCDTSGYSTYESVDNLCAYDLYDDIIIVTQGYHLYRALFIADSMGLEADGISATTREYRGQKIRDLREGLARFKDAIKLIVEK